VDIAFSVPSRRRVRLPRAAAAARPLKVQVRRAPNQSLPEGERSPLQNPPRAGIPAALLVAASLAVSLLFTAPVHSQTPPTPIEVPPPVAPPPYLPFQHLPAVPLDEARNGWGVAQQAARAKNLQGRLLWIDATANLDRVNSADKIAALVEQIRRAGFNTICFDIKPIIGQTLYPSRYAPKMTEWRKNNVTQTLPPAFDPLAEFVRQTRAAKIGLVVNMNAFSEGHRDYGKGPGYERPEWQTVLYEEQARLRVDPTATAAAATQPLSFRVNELPATEDEVAVYMDRVRLLADLPKRKPESVVVALVDAQARVVAQIAGPSFAGLNPAIPNGGAALVGTGASAEFLRRGAVAGQKLALETVPNYVRIGERPRRQVPLMTNPFHPQVRQRLLDMIAEVARNYAVDGRHLRRPAPLRGPRCRLLARNPAAFRALRRPPDHLARRRVPLPLRLPDDGAARGARALLRCVARVPRAEPAQLAGAGGDDREKHPAAGGRGDVRRFVVPPTTRRSGRIGPPTTSRPASGSSTTPTRRPDGPACSTSW
jgi:hypothetical protein